MARKCRKVGDGQLPTAERSASDGGARSPQRAAHAYQRDQAFPVAAPATLALCLGFAFRWRQGARQNSCPPTTAPRSRRVADNAPHQPTGFPLNRPQSRLIGVNRGKSCKSQCHIPPRSGGAMLGAPIGGFATMAVCGRWSIPVSWELVSIRVPVSPSDFGFRSSDLI